MPSRPLQYKKPRFKESTHEPACQKYPGAWRSDAKEIRRSLVVPALAVILYAVTFLGTGGRLAQA
jgi:hypothetical protein